MAQDELQHVQALIAEGRLDEARAILQTIDRPEVPQLLATLDQMQATAQQVAASATPRRVGRRTGFGGNLPAASPSDSLLDRLSQEAQAPAALRAPTAPASGGAPGRQPAHPRRRHLRDAVGLPVLRRDQAAGENASLLPQLRRGPGPGRALLSRRRGVRRGRGSRLRRRGPDLPQLRGAQQRGGGILRDVRHAPDGCRPCPRARLRDAPGGPSFRRRRCRPTS